MKKAFMMIEVIVVIMGLSILLNLMMLIFKEQGSTNHYSFIPITAKCGILCALKKPLP